MVSIAGIRRCVDIARETATALFPPNHYEPNAVPFQKATSKQLAISAWQARWHRADRRTPACFALPSPSSSKLPPVIEGAAGGSCTASATLIRLITGHAFIGSYTARFRPRKPTRCPECGADPQTVSHVIQSCPRFPRAGATYLAPVAPNLSLSLSSLFGTNEGGEALIKFLDVPRPASNPMSRPLTQDDLNKSFNTSPFCTSVTSDPPVLFPYHCTTLVA